MGLFNQAKDLLEKRHEQKINDLIKKIDRDIRDFWEKTPRCYSVNNSTYENIALYEEEVLTIQQAFINRNDKVSKLKKRSRTAVKAFREAEEYFIKRAKYKMEYREQGIAFPEEKKRELKELEMYPYSGDKKRLAKLELMERIFAEVEQGENKPNLKQRELQAKAEKQTAVRKGVEPQRESEIGCLR